MFNRKEMNHDEHTLGGLILGIAAGLILSPNFIHFIIVLIMAIFGSWFYSIENNYSLWPFVCYVCF